MMKKLFTLSTFFLLSIVQSTPPRHKRFNEIRFVMTHNATSLRPEKSILGNILRGIIERFHPSEEIRIKALNAIQRITLLNPNPVADQERNIDRQLKDGVRAFKLPLSKCSDEFRICHTVSKEKAQQLYQEAQDTLFTYVPITLLCNLLLLPLAKFRDNPCMIDTTNVALKPTLQKISTWLNNHPDEVLSFFFDFSQFSSEMEQENFESFKTLLQDVGFTEKMYVHIPGTQWPTIGTMLQQNKRIVIIANTHGFEPLGILHKDLIGFGTNYNYKNLGELAHDSQHPAIDWGTVHENNLFIIDNYTTPYISGNVLDAKVANSYHILKYRLKHYEQLTNHPTTFTMVDFYNEPDSDIFKVIENLNNGK